MNKTDHGQRKLHSGNDYAYRQKNIPVYTSSNSRNLIRAPKETSIPDLRSIKKMTGPQFLISSRDMNDFSSNFDF